MMMDDEKRMVRLDGNSENRCPSYKIVLQLEIMAVYLGSWSNPLFFKHFTVLPSHEVSDDNFFGQECSVVLCTGCQARHYFVVMRFVAPLVGSSNQDEHKRVPHEGTENA